MAERGEHELSLERAGQQIGQIPQTLQTLLHVHGDGVRQRVTATSSYSLVSPSYTERALPRITVPCVVPVIIADKYDEEEETSRNKDASCRVVSRRVASRRVGT